MLQYGSFATFGQMNKTRCSEDRKLEKGCRTGPLESTVPAPAKKGAPRLENCLPSGVGPLPIGASASQCSSYVEEGMRKTHKKIPPHAVNRQSQRNSP